MQRNCWFALDVMKNQERKWDWVALMVDVDPDDLKNYAWRCAPPVG